MNLRAVISRPSRFDEEVFEKTADTICQKLMTKPAYPDLLKNSTVAFREPTRPAAFPSLDLRPHGAGPQTSQLPTISSDENLGQSELKQRTPMKEEADLLDGHQPETQDLVSNAVVQGEVDEIAESHVSVTWSMLSEALQLYIFEGLLTQVSSVDTVIEILGLEILDAKHIEALRNTKNIHPATTDQLLRHCTKISSPNGQHVKPDILDAFMPYFTFAANIESATKYESMLGVQYLRDRKIEGGFVDALCSAINVEDVDAELSRANSSPGSASIPSKQLISEWLARQPDMKIHESHDITSLAPSLLCPYMPYSLRRYLLGKPQDELTPTEIWLTHVNTATTVAERDLIGTLTSAQGFLSEWMSVHMVAEEDLNTYLTALSLNEVAAQELICLFMHMLTAIAAQTADIEEQVCKMPLYTDDKVEVLRSARVQTERQMMSDFVEKLAKYMSSDAMDEYTDHSYDDVFDADDEDSVRPTDVSATTSVEPRSLSSTPPSSTSHHYEDTSRSGAYTSRNISGPVGETIEAPSAPSDYTEQGRAQYFTSDEVRPGKTPISTPRSASPVPPAWSPLSESGQDMQSPNRFSHTFQSLPHATSNNFQPPHLSHVSHATPWQQFKNPAREVGDQVPQSSISQFPRHLLPSMSDLSMPQQILPNIPNSTSTSQPPQTTSTPLDTISVAHPSGSKPRIRSARKDKGKPRGPYNTQKKKADRAAQEAAARKRDAIA